MVGSDLRAEDGNIRIVQPEHYTFECVACGCEMRVTSKDVIDGRRPKMAEGEIFP